MEQVELKISLKDWLYIGVIGAFFGLLFSLFFYFLNEKFQDISTIFFGTFTAICITFFSSLFISVSNSYILPQVNKRFWYGISFGFSFLSGALGFLFSFSLFYTFDVYITNYIDPYSWYLTFIIGSLTFLVGLILHQFISMKYKNEQSKTEILQSKIKHLKMNSILTFCLMHLILCVSWFISTKKRQKHLCSISRSFYEMRLVKRVSSR